MRGPKAKTMMTNNTTVGASDQALVDLNNRLNRAKELAALVNLLCRRTEIHPLVVSYGMTLITKPTKIGDQEYSVEEVKWASQMVMRDYLMEIMPSPAI